MNEVPPWIWNIFLGMVIGLLSIIFRMHQKLDDERHENQRREIEGLREKMHDAQSEIAGIKMLIQK